MINKEEHVYGAGDDGSVLCYRLTVEWRQPAGFGFSRKYPVLDPNHLQLAQTLIMGLPTCLQINGQEIHVIEFKKIIINNVLNVTSLVI